MSDVALQADRDVPELDTTWGTVTGAETRGPTHRRGALYVDR